MTRRVAINCETTPRSLNWTAQYDTPIWYLKGQYGFNARPEARFHYLFHA